MIHINNKIKILGFLIFITIISLSCVSANDTSYEGDLNTLNISDNADDLKANEQASFSSLANQISNARSGDTIILDKDYNASLGGGEITINVNDLTIDGRGHTLDANKASGIFYIRSSNVILNNITFVNSHVNNDYGGAVYFQSEGSIFNSHFINNSASFGASVYFNRGGSISHSTFVNNHVIYSGGSVFFRGNGNVLNCTFVNNSAREGGAIYFDNNGGSVSSSIFINNTATLQGSVIGFYNTSGSLLIKDSVILGKGDSLIYSDIAAVSIIANNNWWGNTADDLTNRPNVYDYVKADSWYYFNVTSFNDTTLYVGDLAKVYVNLTGLASTSGFMGINTSNRLPKLTFRVGTSNAESVKSIDVLNGICEIDLNVLKQGTSTITAEFENISQGISFNVIRYNSNMTIDINDSFKTTDDCVVNIGLPADATGNVNIVLRNPNGIFKSDIVSAEDAGLYHLSNLPADNYIVIVNYLGDDRYYDTSLSSRFNVVKLNSSMNVVVDKVRSLVDIPVHVNLDDNATGFVNIKITDGEGNVVLDDNVDVEDARNYLIPNLTNGNYTVDVSYLGDDIYSPAENSTEFTVNLIHTSIELDLDNITIPINNVTHINATVIPPEINGTVRYITNDSSVVIVDDEGNIIPVGNGTALITIIIGDGDNYSQITKNITVTVEKLPTNITVNDTLGDLHVGDTGKIEANVTPANATGNLNYTSSNPDIIKVNPDGSYEAIDEGEAVITVTYPGDGTHAPSTVEIPVNITFDQKDSLIELQVNDTELGKDVLIEATIDDTATGNITFTFGDDTYTAPIINGTASIKLSNLPIGNYTVQASYDGDKKHLPNSTAADFSVTKVNDYNITLDNDTVKYDNKTIVIVLPENATGNVTIIIDGKNYTGEIKNGTVVIPIDDIAPGEYNGTIIYDGDDEYGFKQTNITINVESNVILNVSDLTKYYHGIEKLEFSLVDRNFNPLSNQIIFVTINGVTYSRVTNYLGHASMNINLDSGVYDARLVFNGDGDYQRAFARANVNVLATVNGTNVFKVYRNDTHYFATFRDSEGNYLANGTPVRFNIHGVFYTRYVNGSEGLAKLNINLESGEYILTAINPVTGEMATNNVTVFSRIIENHDIVKYYRNQTQYTALIIGDDGSPVGAGENVTFNIHGVFYTRQTNATGHVRLNINLEYGDYIITAEYKEARVSNTIKVLPILIAKDLVKKYGTSTPFEAQLVDGQGNPQYNQIIVFNIHGVFYRSLTDENGIARLNINLQRGKYIITSIWEDVKQSNTVTVTR